MEKSQVKSRKKRKDMKQIILPVLLLASTAAWAQTNEGRFINVNGEAELEVIPDEIYMVASIQSDKAEDFDKKDQQFLSELIKMGVKSEDVSLADLNGEYAKVWFKKDQLLKSKTYQVKLRSVEQADAFLKVVERIEANDIAVIRTDISNRKSLEKELRIAAMLDGKQKATYMAEAIGAKVGKVQQIYEQYISLYKGTRQVQSLAYDTEVVNMKSKSEVGDSVIGFKKIKMKITVSMRFDIL